MLLLQKYQKQVKLNRSQNTVTTALKLNNLKIESSDGNTGIVDL